MGAGASQEQIAEQGIVTEKSRKIELTTLEKQILKTRFAILTDNAANATLGTEHFNKEPYLSEPFCKRVIKKQISPEGRNDNRLFYQTLINWQYGPIEYQLKELFDVVRTSSGISEEVLWRVLAHVIPNHTNEEYKGIAKAMIRIMTGNNDREIVSKDEFIKWICSNIEESKLEGALKFKITSFDYK